MLEFESDESLYYPNVGIIALPLDEKLRTAYHAFKPSQAILRHDTERRRTVFPEQYIENPRLGTLEDLCVRAIAQHFGVAGMVPAISNDKRKLRLFYESLSVDLPLRQCHSIQSPLYWKRVVLAKTGNSKLDLHPNYDWRAHGLSLKYVELVEKCPVEYWPAEEMAGLAHLIEPHVTCMHIKNLQSLQEYSFEKYLQIDEQNQGSSHTIHSSETAHVIDVSRDSGAGQVHLEQGAAVGDQIQQDLEREAGSVGGGSGRLRKNSKLMHAVSSQRLARKKLKQPPGKKRKTPLGVFDLKIPPDTEEDFLERGFKHDEEPKAKKRLYNYPPKYCHHIDLSFIRYFDKLAEFSIEFQGPGKDLQESRHLNFSQRDIEHLANGLRHLHVLRIFRLRHSRMDATKLTTVTKALGKLARIEVVDFGNDMLHDDCTEGWEELFYGNHSIKSLELGGNRLGVQSMRHLGSALRNYKGTLEYLGLARNDIDAEALHALVSQILGTPQIAHLCLNGICINQTGILCCIVGELLARHALKRLELVGVHINKSTADAMIDAMKYNCSVQYLDCRCCALHYNAEFKLDLLCRKNRYLEDTLYLHQQCTSLRQMTTWLQRTKNPILLEALQRVKSRAEWQKNLPDITERFTEMELQQLGLEDPQSCWYTDRLSAYHSETSVLSAQPLSQVCSFEHEDLTAEEFLELADVPGSNERYYYFKARNVHHIFSKASPNFSRHR